MTSVRPVTITLLMAVLVFVSIASANPLVLAITAAVTVMLSIMAGGPRRACFHAGTIVAGGIVLVWLFWALLIDQPASEGAVLLNLPRRELGPGVTLGGTKTITWVQQMLTSGADAALTVLALGLLAQLRPARDWLSFCSVALGRGVDLVAPLICLPEALTITRRMQGPAARIDARPRIARPVGRVRSVLSTSAELAAGWRLDHPRRTGLPGDIAAFCAVLVAAALPVLKLCGLAVVLPVPWPAPISVTLGWPHVMGLLVAASVAVHLPAGHHGWLPRPGDLPLIITALVVAGSWVLRDVTGDADSLAVSPGTWPGLPPLLAGSLGLVLATGVLTQVLDVVHPSGRRPARA